MADIESPSPRVDGEPVWNQLDFDHDVVVEASAGTGKTYALERIVLKLVENGYDVSEILLVTFTEKAAGELKSRIRRILAENGKLEPDFDDAAICTIHSFCKDLLAEYAFELRKPMRVEVVASEEELIRDAVRRALDGDAFRKRFGEAYTAWMKAGNFKTTEELVDAAVDKIRKRLRKTREKADETTDKIRETVANALKAFEAPAKEILPDELAVPEESIYKDDCPKLKNALRAINERIPGLLSDSRGEFEKAALEWTFLARTFGNGLNPRTSKPYVPEQKRNGNLCLYDAKWADLVAALGDLAESVRHELLLGLVQLADAEYERTKAEASVMTFDDMVLDASEVVCREAEKERNGDGSALLEAIRKKRRVALVDEFQDTDGRQWDIFRSIFSHEVNKGGGDRKPGFLLVVGDPKQAIYSFRGADIATYLRARREIEDGCPKYRKTLDTTWRSTKEMVDAFNVLFGADGWFDGMTVNADAGEDSIKYAPVLFPGGKSDFADFERNDHTGRGAVTLLESLDGKSRPNGWNGLGNNARCLPVFLENAAHEIRRLMALESAMPVKDKETGEFRDRLKFGDFCVLVRSNRDAETVKRVLGRRGIPYGHYKEAGIYDSAEAEAVLALLDFLSEPWRNGNLAALLLTPFFRVPPERLDATIARKPKAFVKTVESWQLLAAKADWNGLFEDVLSASALARPEAGDFGYDRKWAAIRQIFDKLLAEIGKTATTTAEFAELLRHWRRDDGRAGEGGALRRKESDANRVQIMTMHASKGLEFPVVFVAHGFSSIDKDGMTEEEKADNRQETRRLLYVAITRAKQKLYLPWSKRAAEQKPVPAPADGKPGKRKETRPLWGVGSKGSALRGGFLSSAICALFGGVDGASARTESVDAGEAPAATPSVPRLEPGEHAPAKLDGFPEKALRLIRMRWDSFTSLHRSDADRAETRFAGAAENEFDEERDAADEERKPAGPNLLPGGTDAGQVFHKIMEALCANDGTPRSPDFGSVGNADPETLEAQAESGGDSAFMKLVRDAMRHYLVENRVLEDADGKIVDTTERMLVRMVWNALNAPLRFGDAGPFALKDVAKADRIAETEFAVDEDALVGEGRRAGAFNGAIDLLVRPEGADGPVYVLDWKTNSLGGYGNEAVEEAMESSGYHLQYEIYSLVVRRWLGEGRPNGVAYLFVRGGGAKDGRCGVYLRTLEDGWENRFAEDLRNALPGHRSAAKAEDGK